MARNQKTPKKSARGGTLLGMFIGLVLGVCIAAAVVWYINRASSPFAKPAAKAEAATTAHPAGASAPAGQPLPLPGKPGDAVGEKRFQFYDILPGKADAVPDAKKADGKEEAKKDEPKKEEPRQPIFLQAGSYTVAQDADNQRAKLALLGMEASVLQVMVQDKTFYRVRLGPFTKMDEANKVRSELAKAGVEANLAKKE